MRIVVLGPPGAGKGEQCRRLSGHLGIPHVSTGEMFRAAARQATPSAERLAGIMARGELIPDDLSIRVVRRRIAMPDCASGFLLDGFPRTRGQALGLGKVLIQDGVHLDHVLLLRIDDALALRRIVGRRLDPGSSVTYHVEWDPPPPEVAEEVVRRDDDLPEVAALQLETWRSVCEPVTELYRERDMLVEVDGAGPPAEVFGRILGALGLV